MGLFIKILGAALVVGTTAYVFGGKRKDEGFLIDIYGINWAVGTGNIKVSDKSTPIMSSSFALNYQSAKSFTKNYKGHQLKLSQDQQRRQVTFEVWYENKLVGGNIIDFKNRKVISLP